MLCPKCFELIDVSLFPEHLLICEDVGVDGDGSDWLLDACLHISADWAFGGGWDGEGDEGDGQSFSLRGL